MSHLRPGRVIPALFLLGLLVGLPPMAQETPPVTPPEGPTPSELYRDVKALRLVADLELSEAQIGKIIPVLQQVADQKVADAQADEAAWALVADAAGEVLAALITGMEPPRAQMAQLDRAAAERGQREDFRASLAAEAAVRIQRMLTGQQAARIETRVEQSARKELQARLEGAATPVEYILARLDEQAELMPDEYIRLREPRALEMAQALLGAEAPGVRQLAVGLLGIMNQVASWSAAEYAQQRPTLGEEIGKALDLPDAPLPHQITYDDFIAWITSDRAVPTLKELQKSIPAEPGGGAAVAPPEEG